MGLCIHSSTLPYYGPMALIVVFSKGAPILQPNRVCIPHRTPSVVLWAWPITFVWEGKLAHSAFACPCKTNYSCEKKTE
jgi:hypothetical protein